MKLAVAPISGHHDRQTLLGFYEEVAASRHIDRAYLGELFCAKRLLPLDVFQESVSRLRDRGIEAVFSTLALPAGDPDFDSAVPYVEAVDIVEVNNFGYISWLKERFPNKTFVAGPICNLYNTADLTIIRDWGAAGASQHIDLLHSTTEDLIKSDILPIEVLLYGRPPAAFSWRCYTARFAGKTAAACGSVCRIHQDVALNNLEDADGFIIDGPAVLPGRVIAPIDEAAVYLKAGASRGRLWLRPGEVDRIAALYAGFLEENISASDMRQALSKEADGHIQFEPVARGGLS